jgi:hypothetical protein
MKPSNVSWLGAGALIPLALFGNDPERAALGVVVMLVLGLLFSAWERQ